MATNVKFLNETGKFVKCRRQTTAIRLCINGLPIPTLSILTKLPPILLPHHSLLLHRFFWGQFPVRYLLPDSFHFTQMDFILQLLDYLFHKSDGGCTVQCSVHFEHELQFLMDSLQEQGPFGFHLVFHGFNNYYIFILIFE